MKTHEIQTIEMFLLGAAREPRAGWLAVSGIPRVPFGLNLKRQEKKKKKTLGDFEKLQTDPFLLLLF